MGLSVGFGAATEKNEAIRVIRAGHDGGVTFLDSAEAYGPFTNEELVGETLAPVHDKYRYLGHGFGLGTGTSAEGWIFEAIRFWETAIRR